MTVVRSYSPNGIIRPDPDFNLCCGLFHATAAAKFFSIFFFCVCLLVSIFNFVLFGVAKTWITIFCVVYTGYCILLIYGVFLEKHVFLIPFLFFHGALTLLLIFFIILLCIFGSATNMIIDHHKANIHLRDLYYMHYLNPDNENTQAAVAGVSLSVVILFCVISMYSWYVINQAFQCYKEAHRTMLPGYKQGIVASNEKKFDEEYL